jgi:hypothetical protein
MMGQPLDDRHYGEDVRSRTYGSKMKVVQYRWITL